MHTPGPWNREAFGIWHTNEKGENRRVACAEIDRGEGPYKPSNEAEVVANARLIAAAPELLAACIEAEEAACIAAIHQHPDTAEILPWVKRIRAAIAKATGVQS
jgi:hypothetical protein